jgi:hypothetical protein
LVIVTELVQPIVLARTGSHEDAIRCVAEASLEMPAQRPRGCDAPSPAGALPKAIAALQVSGSTSQAQWQRDALQVRDVSINDVGRTEVEPGSLTAVGIFR